MLTSNEEDKIASDRFSPLRHASRCLAPSLGPKSMSLARSSRSALSSAVANALALLLEGSGYDTKIIIQVSPTALAHGLLDGVDLLLLSPGLINGVRDVLLSIVRGQPEDG